MKLGLPQPIQVILAMMFVPPFALVSGALLGVLLWFLLADAGLPTWARLAISVLVIPGLPGLWVVAMPIVIGRSRVTRLELPEEIETWQNAQFETVEGHQDDFDALRRQRLERVVAGDMSATADRIEMTVVAVELGNVGGVVTVLQHPLEDLRLELEDPHQDPGAIPFIGAITRLTDDVGNDYTVPRPGLRIRCRWRPHEDRVHPTATRPRRRAAAHHEPPVRARRTRIARPLGHQRALEVRCLGRHGPYAG